MAPEEKKNSPLILPLAPFGFWNRFGSVLSAAAPADKGPQFPPRCGVITGFSLEKETPLAG